MSKTYYGFKRALKSIFIGLIFASILKYILNYYDLNELILVLYLLSFIGIYLLYNKMKYWSIWYSFGWIIGILILYQFLNYLEFIIYILVFIISICYNLRYKIKRYLKI